MAFIVIADSKSHEIDRLELTAPLAIGRAAECDLPVRDILLSRRHCLIERIGEVWVIADLSSRNGTHVNGETITRQVLNDRDVVRIGRTRIAFRDAPFVPAPPDVKRSKQRPTDPLEALAGTLSGFKLNDEEETELDRRVLETFPRPKPKPTDPHSYQTEHVQAMIMDLASNAWDAVLVEAEQTASVRTLPKPRIAALPAGLPVMKRIPVTPQPRIEIKSQPAHPRRFDVRAATAMLSIALGLTVSAVSVWVMSWSW